jgi:hypothetical protein
MDRLRIPDGAPTRGTPKATFTTWLMMDCRVLLDS